MPNQPATPVRVRILPVIGILFCFQMAVRAVISYLTVDIPNTVMGGAIVGGTTVLGIAAVNKVAQRWRPLWLVKDV